MKPFTHMTKKDKFNHILAWAWQWATKGTPFHYEPEKCYICGAQEDTIIGGIILHHVFKVLPDKGYRVLPVCVNHGSELFSISWDCETGDMFKTYYNPLWPAIYKGYRAFYWALVIIRFVGFMLRGHWVWILRARGGYDEFV